MSDRWQDRARIRTLDEEEALQEPHYCPLQVAARRRVSICRCARNRSFYWSRRRRGSSARAVWVNVPVGFREKKIPSPSRRLLGKACHFPQSRGLDSAFGLSCIGPAGRVADATPLRGPCWAPPVHSGPSPGLRPPGVLFLLVFFLDIYDRLPNIIGFPGQALSRRFPTRRRP